MATLFRYLHQGGFEQDTPAGVVTGAESSEGANNNSETAEKNMKR